MNQIPAPITHPLTKGQRVVARRPSCPCKGATYTTVEGTIGKVIQNQVGWWYYLSDSGVTVKADWITSVK